MVPRLHRLALMMGILLIGIPADVAWAQGCAPLTVACDTQKPLIAISPTTGRTFQTNTVQVTVTWSDDMYLNADSLWIKQNGVRRDAAFSYVEEGSSAESVGTITLVSGSNTIQAHICDTNGNCETATALYTYAPPPAPTVYGIPQISFVPHNSTMWLPSPFDGTAAYSTPAFISRDVPLAVQLVYHSSRARPMGFVQMDVSDNSITPIARIEVEVRNEAGVLQTLINNSTKMSYHGQNSGVSRVAAQWNADTDSTGAYKYSVTVRTVFAVPDSTTRVTTDTTRVLIVNDRSSYFGAGWNVIGLQRIRWASHGVVVTNGDGSAVYFRKNGSTYTTRAGEFSTLSVDPATQNYIRSFPDGTHAVFEQPGASQNAKLLYITDRFGRKATYKYSAERLDSIRFSIAAQDSLTGPVIGFGYTSNKLATIKDPGGRTNTFTMTSGNLTTIKGPDNVIAFTGTYDSERQLRTSKDRRSKTWDYTYDFAGKLSTTTIPTVTVNNAAVRPVVQYVAWESAALVNSTQTVRPRVDPNTVRAQIADPNNAVTKFNSIRSTARHSSRSHLDTQQRSVGIGTGCHGESFPQRANPPRTHGTTMGRSTRTSRHQPTRRSPLHMIVCGRLNHGK